MVLFGFGLWGDTRPWFFRENLLSSYSKCIDCVSSIESLVAAGFGIPRCLFVLVLVFLSGGLCFCAIFSFSPMFTIFFHFHPVFFDLILQAANLESETVL